MPQTPPVPSPENPSPEAPSPAASNREPRPESGGERARRIAGETFELVRDETQRLVARYRAQSRYFKWRSWIVAAYALIAITSVVMALPPSNSIDAYVVPTRDFRNRIIVSVENQSEKPWTRVRLVLDDVWVFERDELPPGEKVTPNITQFVKIKSPDKENAPESLQPKVLRVETAQGKYQMQLFGKR